MVRVFVSRDMSEGVFSTPGGPDEPPPLEDIGVPQFSEEMIQALETEDPALEEHRQQARSRLKRAQDMRSRGGPADVALTALTASASQINTRQTQEDKELAAFAADLETSVTILNRIFQEKLEPLHGRARSLRNSRVSTFAQTQKLQQDLVETVGSRTRIATAANARIADLEAALKEQRELTEAYRELLTQNGVSV